MGSTASKINRIVTAMFACVATAGLLASCASASNNASPQQSFVSVNNTEPSTGLIPSDTSDMAGWKVVTQLFDGLVTFDNKGGLQYVGAQSIEPNADASKYTITLKPGLTFSNGEAITADTYAKTWSFAANAANGQMGASIFATIQGYDQLQDPKGDKNATLSGLHVVNDTTLEVTLNAPDSSFPYKVGDVAFLPLPSSAFSDIKKFGEHPIGNGPYELKDWQHDQSITLVPNPKYAGPRSVRNGGITFQIYQSLDSAYADLLAGNLDVLDTIPNAQLATYRSEKRVTAFNQPGPAFVSLTIPQNLAHFSGKEGQLRRQAIAHAIERDKIASAIFKDTVTPATDFLAPVIKGYSKDLDSDGALKYDEALAKQLWDQANEIAPWEGSFEIAYASDGTDKEWVDAVAHSLTNVLGIDAKPSIFPTNKELSSAIHDRTVGAAFRSGLQSDYPHPEGYLVQGYASWSGGGTGLNHGDYNSAEFDGLMRKAAAESDIDKAVAIYQDSERVLLRDLPVIPLWYRNVTAAAGKKVSTVPFNYMGVPDYVALEIKS